MFQRAITAKDPGFHEKLVFMVEDQGTSLAIIK
jgi:hypothetical protein